jgi:hypothetical protein
MKNSIKKLIIVASLLLLPVITIIAQSPPHPNGGNAPGGTNTPVGGGAPLGEGIIFLLTMGLGYGVRKYRQIRKMI